MNVNELENPCSETTSGPFARSRKPPDLPSHGRGHRFDPTAASSGRRVCPPDDSRVCTHSRELSGTPADYDQLRSNLVEFRDAYVPYINKTLQSVYTGNTAERARVLQLAVTASDAVDISGVRVAVFPPAFAPNKPVRAALVFTKTYTHRGARENSG